MKLDISLAVSYELIQTLGIKMKNTCSAVLPCANNHFLENRGPGVEQNSRSEGLTEACAPDVNSRLESKLAG